MVVAATDFYKALSDPLQAIQDLYEKEGDKATFPAAVGTHFQKLFRESEARAKITPLTQSLLRGEPVPESGPSTRNARLVRWRCMVQDTGMGSELMPRRYRSNEGSWKNGLFGAVCAGDEDDDAEPDVNPSQLSSLTTLYGVSMPGQSRWSQLADQRLESSTALEGDLLCQMEGINLNGKQSMSGNINAKLPTGLEMGALLKVYDEEVADSVRVAQIVDVIGILDQSPIPAADWSSVAGEETNSALHPTIHVISLQRADMELGDAHSGHEAEIRDELIGYLAQGLQGDRHAAQWLLLSLVAKIHSRSASHTLGPLSLNISSFPPSPASQLPSLLSDILPFVVNQSLELSHLNDHATRFAPTSQADDAGLQAGRLQLVDGTVLLVDENTMQEGELKETGIHNIRMLSNLLTTRKLTYTFPYSNLEMDADVGCIIVSQGKSFLPADVQVPLRPQEGKEGNSTSDRRFSLDDYRHYLAAMQLRSSQAKLFSITSDMSDTIQTDFVQSRSTKKQTATMGSHEDLSRAIHVARLLCLSRGATQLDWQDWTGAKALDEERVLRLAM